ncbi:hypothetical protein BT96DRAFT_1025334 [Gymnopus androsaceus JB14]|uniref:Uncharacterized protein n=1 Tax=Gymnopus androsaceus JB14 TaxID=1447944 RepID=A0A6A4GS96_9AGAR|nr:hypothetical protein BT96DRAFT_1025334 [Gymnopus androsaceus JB14]
MNKTQGNSGLELQKDGYEWNTADVPILLAMAAYVEATVNVRKRILLTFILLPIKTTLTASMITNAHDEGLYKDPDPGQESDQTEQVGRRRVGATGAEADADG